MPTPDEIRRSAHITLDETVLQGAGVVQGGILAGAVAEAIDEFSIDLVDSGSVVALETLDVGFERPGVVGSYTVEAALRRRGRTLLAWDARLVDAGGKTVVAVRSTHRVRPRSA